VLSCFGVCQIEKRGDRSTARDPRRRVRVQKIVDLKYLRTQFIDLVTDENLPAALPRRPMVFGT